MGSEYFFPGDEYSDWRDTANDSPKKMTRKLVERLSDLGTDGRANDPDA